MSSVKTPLVSIIIPSYNAQEFIRECLDSVLAQTLHDIEVIVVDDGSTDTTRDIVAGYAERDPRVTLICQENSFAGVARNNGMEHASGTYLYFLDSDDFIDPHALEAMTQAAASCDADVVVCRSKNFSMKDGSTAPISYALRDFPLNTPLAQGEIAKTLFHSVVGWPWDKLFKTSFIHEHGLRYQALRSTNDAFFVFMAMALAQTTYCLDKTLVTHRIDNRKSISNTRRKSWNNALIAMDAIGERLREERLYERFERTYLNWCVNFVYWNVNTLDDESACGLIAAAREKLHGVPTDDPAFYFLRRDYDFARFMNMTADELVLTAARQREECVNAKKVYATRTYRLAKKLMKPARFVKHRILKK